MNKIVKYCEHYGSTGRILEKLGSLHEPRSALLDSTGPPSRDSQGKAQETYCQPWNRVSSASIHIWDTRSIPMAIRQPMSPRPHLERIQPQVSPVYSIDLKHKKFNQISSFLFLV